MTDGRKPRTREDLRRLVDQALLEREVGQTGEAPVGAVVDVVTDLVSSLFDLPNEGIRTVEGERVDGGTTPGVDAAPPTDDLAAELIAFADRIDAHGFVHAMGGHARTLRLTAEALRDRRPPSDWHWCDAVRPEAGRRVVILHEDGSGAALGYWTGDVLIDAEGDEGDWRDEPGAMWTHMPRGMKLWCEVRGEDPYTFPDDEPSSPSPKE